MLSNSILFDYLEEPSHRWADVLAGMKSGCLETKVHWGAHEKAPGVIDFQRGSLRLEKLLKLVADRKMTLNLWIGFPAGKHTFPAWSLSLEDFAWVPTPYWESTEEGFHFTKIPSLENPQYKASFLTFLNELLSLVGLYQAPEGPVSQVYLDTSLYLCDASVSERNSFLSCLQSRYACVDELNDRYGTRFGNLASALGKNGLRTLIGRRPWLAAYDFKWCRKRVIERFLEEVEALPALHNWKGAVHFSRTAVEAAASDKKWAILMDATVVEENQRRLFPFMPSGLSMEPYANAFHLCDYMMARANAKEIPLFFLEELSKKGSLVPRFLTILSGRYLASSNFKVLNEFLSRGMVLYFPFGLPQYDECIQRLAWNTGAPSLFQSGTDGVYCLIKERGALCTPETAPLLDDSFFEQLERAMALIEAKIP